MDIVFKVTDQRTELLPMGVFRQLDTHPRAQLYFVAHYLVNENGDYLIQYDPETGQYADGVDDAWAILDPLPIRQIVDLVAELQGNVEMAAVPKA